VLIDSALLAAQSRELAEKMARLEQEAYEIAGQPFNLGSPKQIGEILFGKLGLPVGRKTASGAPSTDEDVLQELAADYPLPGKLLEHRSLSKLKGTYTDKLPLMVNPETGRVHTTYAQAVAVTGRLSSNDPNLQNIPIRTAEGRRIREAFIAPEGSSILSADYSQIELRIMAHISADAGLLAAFGSNVDIHRATAAEVFAVAFDDVSHEQRRFAKVINFGLIYGMSAFGLAQNLGIERSAATAYIERYFARYPGVKRYMDETRAQSSSAAGTSKTSSSWTCMIIRVARCSRSICSCTAIIASLTRSAAVPCIGALIAWRSAALRRGPGFLISGRWTRRPNNVSTQPRSIACARVSSM